MPIFIAALLGGLIQAAGTLVGKVLISLGIGYVTYTGVDASIAWVKSMIVSHANGLPSTAIAVASACSLGSVISIVLSALTARLVLDGLTGGTIKRMVLK